MAAYFPSFATIDCGRFPDIPNVEESMCRAGYTNINSESAPKPAMRIDSAYEERVADKFISTLGLIPDDEFESGLQRLKDDVATHGALEEPFIWEAIVISGERAVQ